MKVVHCEEERLHHSRRSLLREVGPVLRQALEELASMAELRDEVKVVGRLVRLVVLYDIWVVQGG